MKEWLNKNKIILIICAAIIIAGIIMLFAKGFNKDTYYSANKKIEAYIPTGYEKEDIINIAKESFNDKKFRFEEIEKLEQVAAIRVINPSEEEIENFKNKIKEKYELTEENSQIYELDMPTTRIKTFIEPYVFPVCIVTILSLSYICLINFKNKTYLENMFKLIIVLFFTMGVYFSLILICRIPFGIYTIPVALSIYIISLLISTYKLQK